MIDLTALVPPRGNHVHTARTIFCAAAATVFKTVHTVQPLNPTYGIHQWHARTAQARTYGAGS